MAADAAGIRDTVISAKFGGVGLRSGGSSVRDDCGLIPDFRGADVFPRSTRTSYVVPASDVAGVVLEAQSVDGEELSKMGQALRLAPRGEHVMGEMEFIVLPLVVWSQKSLHVTPRTLDGSMYSGVQIHESD